MASLYLFDTHALVFWNLKIHVSETFIDFFDERADSEKLLVSAVSFWEAALLAKKGKIQINDVGKWKKELVKNSGIQIVEPDADDMIDSVNLPDIHKDPFDRLLIVQANRHEANLVTKDEMIGNYPVRIFWV